MEVDQISGFRAEPKSGLFKFLEQIFMQYNDMLLIIIQTETKIYYEECM